MNEEIGYLGGDVTCGERYKLRDKYITPLLLFATDFGWRGQCRCGNTLWVRWRARWYCTMCAKRHSDDWGKRHLASLTQELVRGTQDVSGRREEKVYRESLWALVKERDATIESLRSEVGSLRADARRWQTFMNHPDLWGSQYHTEDDDWELLSPDETRDLIDTLAALPKPKESK